MPLLLRYPAPPIGRKDASRQWSGFDVRYPAAANTLSERQIQAPLASIICQWSFDSNIRKSAYREEMRMLESDH
jgi:hypothetical protein